MRYENGNEMQRASGWLHFHCHFYFGDKLAFHDLPRNYEALDLRSALTNRT